MIRSLGRLAVAGLALGAAMPLPAADVPILVKVLVQDPESRPMPGTPVRVVLAQGEGWQRAEAGHAGITDGGGWIAWRTRGAPVQRSRKMPTNFTTQALAAPQPTTHFAVGVEQPWFGKPRLVVSGADRFPDGTTAQLEPLRVLNAGPDGAFTLESAFAAGEWKYPDLETPMNTAPQRWTAYRIEPDGEGWTITIAVRRLAEPVRR